MAGQVYWIGPRCLGRRNEKTYPGTCRFCGQGVTMTAYETRSWICVLWVPVIPLARKQVLGLCPACQRHVQLDFDRWDTARQLTTSGAMERFRANPNPDTAIEVHQQLLAYLDFTQASTFRATLIHGFSQNARIQAHIGATLAGLGRFEEAAGHFRKALELRPDMPEARIGVAEEYLRVGRLDDARQLLDFMEARGGGLLYSLQPLAALVIGYQQARQHEKALEILTRVLTDNPTLVDHGPFRALVERSEQALGRTGSILLKPKPKSWLRLLDSSPESQADPAGQRTRRRLAAACAAGICLVLSLTVGNLYNRGHRALHVVNGHAEPVSVSLDGRAPARMLPGTTLEFTVGEGRHRAELSGAVTRSLRVEVRSPFWSRWTTSPVWVLNPGGAAVLMEETTLYRGRTAATAAVRVHAGVEMEYFRHLDAVFAPLPPQGVLKEDEERRRTQLDVLRGDPAGFVEVLTRHGRVAAAADLAEWRLKQAPNDERMASLYPRITLDRGFRDRAIRFLEAGISNPPPLVSWHRAYLELQTGVKERARLAERYERWLESAPSNASLFYLRGQAADNAWEAGSWFRQATNIDPANPLPVLGLAWNRMVQGAWSDAMPLLTRASQLDPRQTDVSEGLRLARLATGDLASLEAEHWQRVRVNPRALEEMLRWCDVMALQGRRAEAERGIEGWSRQFEQGSRTTAARYAAEARGRLLYALGAFDELLASPPHAPPIPALYRYYALVEKGRVSEAVAQHLKSPAAITGDAVHTLALCLALRLAGASAEADTWSRRAALQLAGAGGYREQAGKILVEEVPPGIDFLQGIPIPVREKALIAAIAARRYPSLRSAADDLARRLNPDPSYPHHLIARALGQTRGAHEDTLPVKGAAR